MRVKGIRFAIYRYLKKGAQPMPRLSGRVTAKAAQLQAELLVDLTERRVTRVQSEYHLVLFGSQSSYIACGLPLNYQMSVEFGDMVATSLVCQKCLAKINSEQA